jgi:NTE family protein
MTRPKIGLALGSGAARGWAHIGVIDALTEAGIAPDIVCGTSIGALVGAAHIAGRMAELRQWAEGATWRKIARLTDVRFTGGGLVSGRQIVSFMNELGVCEPIENYATAYAAVATDLSTGREIWLQSGPIHDAVRASIAIPGVFSPVRANGKWLLDGGLSNPVPVSVCRALGAEVIIAVNLNGELLGRRFSEPEPPDATRAARPSRDSLWRMLPFPGRRAAPVVIEPVIQEGPPPGYFDVLTSAINIMQDHITRTRLAGEPPHVLLVPRLRTIGLMEFNRAHEAIAEGRACVEQALPALQRYI